METKPWDKTLVIDLDGTLCEFKKEGESYVDVLPKPDASQTLKELKAAGWTIIINTARGMGSQDRNVGEINMKVLPVILEWLKKWDIPCDEIVIAKPNARFYIDDKAIPYQQNWNAIKQQILQ